MNKIILNIEGMTCSACSSSLEKYLNKQQNILDATVNLVMATASITYESPLTIEDINKFISEAGFKSLGEYDEQEITKSQEKKKNHFIIFGILAILLMYISMSHMLSLPSIRFLDMQKYPLNYAISLLIITIPFLIFGKDILKSGYKNLIHKSPNMDTLVSIGVLSSFLYSLFQTIMIIKGQTEYVDNLYYESSAIVIYFIKLGRYIDNRSKDKTKEAIKKLVEITPEKAYILENNQIKEVSIDEVTESCTLISKPGMKIAVDGTITKGTTHLDESFITGESIPSKKKVGDKVIAGNLNYDGYIEYKAEKIGRDSTISGIVKLVVEATNTKVKIARLADKISTYFVPIVMIISFLSLIINLLIGTNISETINTFVSVLVVACPCALGLATPLAIIVSEGLCASNGILVKSSESLEITPKVDTIVFDKTGTLTFGTLKINKIYNYTKKTEKSIMEIVCSLESLSNHPLSKPFIEYANKNNIMIKEVKEFQNMDGLGLKGHIGKYEVYLGNSKLVNKLEIENTHLDDEEKLTSSANSIIYIIVNKEIVGLIGISDIIKDNAYSTIEKLQSAGIEIIMLTGDNEKTANIIAKSLGIKNVIANVLPNEKSTKIKELKNKGKTVMMVGDGINDAPSLAIADIGVSLSGATEIAIDTSDIILLNNNLEKLLYLIKISNKTIANIKQNLFWAFFYNILMIPIALGLLKNIGLTLNPMLASIAMTLSSITVILNVLRLRNIKLERGNKNE